MHLRQLPYEGPGGTAAADGPLDDDEAPKISDHKAVTSRPFNLAASPIRPAASGRRVIRQRSGQGLRSGSADRAEGQGPLTREAEHDVGEQGYRVGPGQSPS